MKIRKTEFKTVQQALAHAALHDQVAVMLEGGPATITKAAVRRLEAAGVPFAYVGFTSKSYVTIPVNAKTEQAEEPGEDALTAALRDNFTPEACAAIASFLDGADTSSFEVNKELGSFAEQLRVLVGGNKEWSRLCQEIGL